MAYSKKTVAPEPENTTNTNENADSVAENNTAPAPAPKTFVGSDLIPCRSVTNGSLICTLGKDREVYTWEGYGDITEVTYDDLMSLRAKKSAFIFDPLFIIEDEDVINNPRWVEVKKFYDSLYDNEDINDILNLPIAQFKKVFNNLPKGLKDAVMTEISTQLDAGTFDSIQKLKYVDEVCGSDLACQM